MFLNMKCIIKKGIDVQFILIKIKIGRNWSEIINLLIYTYKCSLGIWLKLISQCCVLYIFFLGKVVSVFVFSVFWYNFQMPKVKILILYYNVF